MQTRSEEDPIGIKSRSMFTWIPIHREAIHKILEYRQNQTELLQILREMEQRGLSVIHLQDKDASGQPVPLAEIDPFTFLASFNRGIKEQSRRDNWAFLKERWALRASVPEDFSGIPIFDNRASWLFPPLGKREKDHVPHLWQVAALAADGGIENMDEESFSRCLKLRKVGIGSLTIGLFWINPENFLPADHKTTAYGKAEGITTDPVDYQSYLRWLKEMTDKVGQNYPQVSHDAHLFAITPPKLDLTPARMQMLWERFRKVISGFEDFQNPGDEFVKNETSYKRTILKRFQQELGAGQLTALVSQGEGTKALNEIGSLLVSPPSNFVSFYGWKSVFGDGEQVICEMLGEFLKVAGQPYEGPASTRDLFDAFTRHGIKPKWDVVGALLWALRPDDFFPIKISYYRDLSEELAHPLPHGLPDADKLHRLIEFGRAFWEALKPQKPTDWVDVQSFIWCVCRHESGDDKLGKPFDSIFTSLEEARDSFEVLRWTLDTLGVSSIEYKDDSRIALTLPQGRNPALIRLNYGNWPILAFFGAGRGQRRVDVICQKKLVEHTGAPLSGELADTFDAESFTTISIGLASVMEDATPEKNAFRDSLVQAQKHFAGWSRSNYRRHHRAELLRMVYDEAERERLLRQGLTAIDGGHNGDPPASQYTEADALLDLFISPQDLRQILARLKRKKALILQGPPGVGKTFIARRLAYVLMGERDDDRVTMVQFHPSYGYEDFVQGYRPSGTGLERRDGVFYQFAANARNDPTRDWFFIIDEINRGNLPKILGELLMLLEADKRGPTNAIPLTYSEGPEETFYLPANVYIIGTMNTADRSLAMVDYALRRRFSFSTLVPAFDSSAFAAWLKGHNSSESLIAQIRTKIGALNEVIEKERDLGPGFRIGHSFFCPSANGIPPDEAWYREVIASEVQPLLEEYFESRERVGQLVDELLS